MSGDIEIGAVVVYDGRRYLVRGFTRASSPVQHVVLEDLEVRSTVVTTPVDKIAVEHHEERE